MIDRARDVDKAKPFSVDLSKLLLLARNTELFLLVSILFIPTSVADSGAFTDVVLSELSNKNSGRTELYRNNLNNFLSKDLVTLKHLVWGLTSSVKVRLV